MRTSTMDISEFKIIENRSIAQAVYRMVLEGDTSSIERPGEFVDVRIPKKYLRRPISVSDYSANRLVLVYKILGEGTDLLSQMGEGEVLELLTGLGHGFRVAAHVRPLLIGGGVGVPPLLLLAKRLVQEGVRPTVVLGFNTAADVFYEKEFAALTGEAPHIATMDGTRGVRGTVIDALRSLAGDEEELKTQYDYFYSCGPMPMLRAVCALPIDGEVSLEERMGCGFGACMGCTIKTHNGPQRVCKEGPVFKKDVLIW